MLIMYMQLMVDICIHSNAINQLPCTPSRGKPRKLPKYPSWSYKRIQIKISNL